MELLYQDAQIAVCIKPQGVLSEAGPGSLPGLLQDALGGSYIRSTDWTAM